MTSGGGGAMRAIDHDSPIPYYHQLADILRDEIERGRWSADEMLPAEGEMMRVFGVSRSVTRKALEMLEDEGRVLRIKGKGTVVTRAKFAYEGTTAARRWFSQRADSVRFGRMISADRVTSGGGLSSILTISPREEVWELVFTHTLDNDPVSVSQMYLLIKGTLTVSAPPEFEDGGPDVFNQLATHYGVDVVSSQVEIDVDRATNFESDVLRVAPGSHVVQVSSLDSSESRLVGFTRTAVRPENFFFAVDAHRTAEARGRALISEAVARADGGP